MIKSDYKLFDELANALPFENIAFEETTLKGFPTNKGRTITMRATRKHPMYGMAVMFLNIKKQFIRSKNIDKSVLFASIKHQLENGYNDEVIRYKQGKALIGTLVCD